MRRMVDEPYFTHSAYSAHTTGIQVKCPKCHGAGVVTADEDNIDYILFHSHDDRLKSATHIHRSGTSAKPLDLSLM
ncbi:hypothetical protein [Flavonifractor sp. An306]|uniref:hypothetical protein n=1 Tax=Flavonifractor sp. An306 TaxID=1965629 RepID=UPI001FA90341|nr:hypothetical protein [Flavonifractor sp. An306]